MRKAILFFGFAFLIAIGPIVSHADDGARLVALTASRVTTALGYTPVNPSASAVLTGGFTYQNFVSGSGVYPTQGQGLALAWNASGGSAETNLWNTYTAALPGYSFEFEQQTGAAAKTSVLRVGASGAGIPKLAAAPTTAPGAGWTFLYFVAGTNAGTCKLQAMAGTSITPSTIFDNIGTGC